MITQDAVSANKLRGGYYSPDGLVDLCFDRINELVEDDHSLRILEPSAGDGAFIRGAARHRQINNRVRSFDAVELIAEEAAACRSEMTRLEIEGEVHNESAIRWATTTSAVYDAAVGNPPFVRFQFVPAGDKAAIPVLEERIGTSFRGVSNLWLPLLLGSLNRLSLGGAFAFIIPSECLTGISAGVFRQWLVASTNRLRIDLFPPGSFPNVLQEVVVLSGTRCATREGSTECEIREHAASGYVSEVVHQIGPSALPWTRYLLSRSALAALDEASELGVVTPLSNVAKFEVASVTGANDFFSIDAATVADYSLRQWSTPLLPRLRYAPGLRYTAQDHSDATSSGAKTHLLDFSGERADPTVAQGPLSYIESGEERGLHERYKCRIRDPWYRVPFIRRGDLMMSKRSHSHPKVVVDDAGVVTTDTIYRGTMTPDFAGRKYDLAAAFHNSLTLLSAEVEGRSFGGGVLELVPSEVARLLVPTIDGFGVEIDRLDQVARTNEDEALVHETDLLLAKADIGFSTDLLERLSEARHSLLSRRLDRNAQERG